MVKEFIGKGYEFLLICRVRVIGNSVVLVKVGLQKITFTDDFKTKNTDNQMFI